MKTKNISAALFALVLGGMAFCSCEKSAEQSEIQRQVIHVSLPAESRVGFSDDNQSRMSLSWSANDQLTVIGETTAVYTIQPGFSDKEADFAGDPVAGTSFTVLYPGTATTEEAWAALAHNGLTQAGNGDTSHIPYLAKLSGINTLSDLSFTSSWAESHGGSFVENGVVRIDVTLPAEITSVSKVSLAGLLSTPLTLEVTGGDFTSERRLIAYLPLGCESIILPAGSKLTLSLKDAEQRAWQKELTLTPETTLSPGKVHSFKLNSKNWVSRYAGGRGTAEDPFQIATAGHLVHMQEDLDGMESDGTLYFVLNGDVDLEETSWIPVNKSGNAGQLVSLDGKEHSIRNLKLTSGSTIGLFSHLYGSVKNLTLDSPSVTTSGKIIGALAGQAGDVVISKVTVQDAKLTGNSYLGGLVGKLESANKVEISDCHVTAEMKATESGSKKASVVGGLVSRMESSVKECLIARCSTSGTIALTSTNYNNTLVGGIAASVICQLTVEDSHSEMELNPVGGGSGGIVGRVQVNTDDPKTVTIRRCHYSGDIKAQHNFVGGIAGRVANLVIADSWSEGSIDNTGKGYFGGLVGRNDAGTNSVSIAINSCFSTMTISGNAAVGGLVGYVEANGLSLKNSLSWGSVSSAGKATDGSAAACVGQTTSYSGNTYANNFRSPDYSFSWQSYKLFDNAADAPMSGKDSDGHELTGKYMPYHGSAALENSTLSSVARTLGWSEKVWNLDGVVPVLR